MIGIAGDDNKKTLNLRSNSTSMNQHFKNIERHQRTKQRQQNNELTHVHPPHAPVNAVLRLEEGTVTPVNDSMNESNQKLNADLESETKKTN